MNRRIRWFQAMLLSGVVLMTTCAYDVSPWADGDGDGIPSHRDCDDPASGNPVYYYDGDNDEYGSPDEDKTLRTCGSAPDNYASNSGDCDDEDENIHPGRQDVCDHLDNDCDGVKDEDPDVDNDGQKSELCGGPDCDEGDPNTYKGAEEICDEKDNNCDGKVDEGGIDLNGDGELDPSEKFDTDGDRSSGCEGEGFDCDDDDSNTYPGAREICDTRDNDCDDEVDEDVTLIEWFRDQDNDLYGSGDSCGQSCEKLDGCAAQAGDCNDSNPSSYPNATENCDGTDNDCDGSIDEGLTRTWYADTDRDGYGDADSETTACSATGSYVSNNTDCDDTHADTYPQATESCDGRDNDCDTQIDENVLRNWYRDTDGDTYGVETLSQEACVAPAGYVGRYGDCDDSSAKSYPGAAETCDDVDNDCDGTADDGLSYNFYYRDADGDSYGSPQGSLKACAPPAYSYSENSQDCNDTDSAIHPGVYDRCDDIDNDCDGRTDQNPCASCLEIKNVQHGASGRYMIDPDGTGGRTAFEVYCDMTTAGGGWTVLPLDFGNPNLWQVTPSGADCIIRPQAERSELTYYQNKQDSGKWAYVSTGFLPPLKATEVRFVELKHKSNTKGNPLEFMISKSPTQDTYEDWYFAAPNGSVAGHVFQSASTGQCPADYQKSDDGTFCQMPEEESGAEALLNVTVPLGTTSIPIQMVLRQGCGSKLQPPEEFIINHPAQPTGSSHAGLWTDGIMVR